MWQITKVRLLPLQTATSVLKFCCLRGVTVFFPSPLKTSCDGGPRVDWLLRGCRLGWDWTCGDIPGTEKERSWVAVACEVLPWSIHGLINLPAIYPVYCIPVYHDISFPLCCKNGLVWSCAMRMRTWNYVLSVSFSIVYQIYVIADRLVNILSRAYARLNCLEKHWASHMLCSLLSAPFLDFGESVTRFFFFERG